MANVMNGHTAKFNLGQNVKIEFATSEFGKDSYDYEPGTVVGIGYDSELEKFQYDVKWCGGTNKVYEHNLS